MSRAALARWRQRSALGGVAVLWAANVACAGTGGLGGDEIGYIDDAPFATPETQNDGEDTAALAGSPAEAECVEGNHGIDSHINVLSEAGTLWAQHVGLDTHCGAVWTYAMSVTDGRVDVAYFDAAAAVDAECSCAFTVRYPLGALSEGSWVMSAAGDETSFEVEP